MGKFVGIQTRLIFDSLWELGKIDNHSLNFILDTGQIYTHGIYINGAIFGTAANGAVSLSIAGTTNTLALSNHTHSDYLLKNANIDLTSYKIVSGNKDLLYYSGGNVYVGNSSSPTYLYGTSLSTVRNSTTYTVLDTGNFNVTTTLPSGYTFNNTALIKYGSSSFLIDYVKRINTSLSFDSLNTYTLAGTNLLNGVYYGYMTLYTDNIYNNPSWAQLRVNIPNKIVEFRTSADTNNWISLNNPTPTWRPVKIEGTEELGSATNTGALDLSAGLGIELTYDATNKKVVITNTSPDIDHNSDRTGVKLGTVSGTKKTDSTLIITNSATGLVLLGGTNLFKIGNGTNYIEIPIAHGLSTKNLNINGSNYALYTSAGSLPTLYVPTTLGTDGQILGTNGTTLEWKTLEKDALYTATLSEVDLTTSWSNVDNLSTRLTESGSYIIQITYASCIYTGTFSYVLGGAVDDEIILHCSGTIDSVGGTNRGRLYAKIGTSSETTYLKLAVSQSESNANLSIKYRKLI